MLRLLVVFIPSFILACSSDNPTSTAPAGKANCPLCGFLGGEHSAQDGAQDQATEPEEEETEEEEQEEETEEVQEDAPQDESEQEPSASTESPPEEEEPIQEDEDEEQVIYADDIDDVEDTEIVQPEDEDLVVVDEEPEEDLSGLTIEFVFGPDVPEADKRVFKLAAQRWESIIHTRLVIQLLVEIVPERGKFGFGPDARAEVLSFGTGGFPEIGQILYGEASRQRIRESMGPYYNSRQHSSMDAFVDAQLYEVALHEMGHVLGIGSMQAWDDLIQSADSFATLQPPYAGSMGQIKKIEQFFTGQSACEGFRRIQEAFRVLGINEDRLYAGEYIPLHKDGNHWGHSEEDSMDILSGNLNFDVQGFLVPLTISPITRGALRDLGYDVEIADSIVVRGNSGYFIKVTGI